MTFYTAIIIFFIATVVIAVAGTMLTRAANQLADLTGIGEAMFGAVFLGSITSIPGIVTSVVAAYEGYPKLAISNAMGGIAAQLLFLSIADIVYRKRNLEHAAASLANLMQGVLLIVIMAIVLLGISGPEVTVFHIHPFSILMILVYLVGLKLISKSKAHPMWTPQQTRETVPDEPNEEFIKNLSLPKVIARFVLLAIIVAAAGYAVAKSGMAIADQTGLSESIVGAIFTAIATSLPELIVSIAAVRQKALTLAVGNIIGGNSFDILFIAFADLAFLDGSILHAITGSQLYLLALTLLMTSVLLLGLLDREKFGIGKIGWESFLIMVIYVVGNLFLFFF